MAKDNNPDKYQNGIDYMPIETSKRQVYSYEDDNVDSIQIICKLCNQPVDVDGW